MRRVAAKGTGLRTDRRISHVFIMDVPAYADTVVIAHGTINIFPDLDLKRDMKKAARVRAQDLRATLRSGQPPRWLIAIGL
jgi:phosphate acetyltransferase